MLERAALEPGLDLLDVGTGSGGNIAIPAAAGGAKVVGLDVTPELFDHARRHAADAGVEVEWIEGDAQELPFADASFDRVISTFGAMFAPNHAGAAAELVRVCRPAGRRADDHLGKGRLRREMSRSPKSSSPPPPPGEEPPPLWGVEAHAREMFTSAGVSPEIAASSSCSASPRSRTR